MPPHEEPHVEIGRFACCVHGKLCCRGRKSKADTPGSRSSSCRSRSAVSPAASRPAPPATYTKYQMDQPPEPTTKKLSQGAYVGIMDPVTAETYIARPTSFVLYHLLTKTTSESQQAIEESNRNYTMTGLYSPENIDGSLPLHIAYRRMSGTAIHFPIVESEEVTGRPTYSIGCAPNSNRFFTIHRLVHFYKTFTCGNRFDSDHGLSGEVFPMEFDTRSGPPSPSPSCYRC
ncbi:unnamed protein product, partial [Mesorhabditis spiculigera]